MADAKPTRLGADEAKKETKGPKIEYFGEGAEKVKFTKDPNATLIRVFGDGRVLVDY